MLGLRRNNERLIQAARDRLVALQLSGAFIDQLVRERKVHQTVTFRSPQSGVVDNLNIREGFLRQARDHPYVGRFAGRCLGGSRCV